MLILYDHSKTQLWKVMMSIKYAEDFCLNNFLMMNCAQSVEKQGLKQLHGP